MGRRIAPDDHITQAEAKRIKAPPRKWTKQNSSLGWPLVPMDVWNMDWTDPQTNDPDKALFKEHRPPPGRLPPYALKYKKYIRCRLEQSKYTHAEAVARCEEIHGTSFNGVFRSGRFWVFWSKGES